MENYWKIFIKIIQSIPPSPTEIWIMVSQKWFHKAFNSFSHSYFISVHHQYSISMTLPKISISVSGFHCISRFTFRSKPKPITATVCKRLMNLMENICKLKVQNCSVPIEKKCCPNWKRLAEYGMRKIWGWLDWRVNCTDEALLDFFWPRFQSPDSSGFTRKGEISKQTGIWSCKELDSATPLKQEFFCKGQ